MSFPITRLRRLRRTPALRRLVQETHVTPDDLILPLFVAAGITGREPVESMPGVCRSDIDGLLADVDEALGLGLRAVMLFGIPLGKDAQGSDTWDDDNGVIQRACRAVKARFHDEIVCITDVCFCEYTDHGHCGVLTREGTLDNDRTLENLQRQAVSHARAGSDMLAPSGMLDGMVEVMRFALDEEGFAEHPIMSYAAKFCSAFYGPFRDAAGSSPETGDRKAYQMNPGNAREALHELELDDAEGADILMVKPALPYLDVIARARQEFERPIAAYQVSGEFAMIQAAAERGWLDRRACMNESLTAIKRAGADLILTYFARDYARDYARGFAAPRS